MKRVTSILGLTVLLGFSAWCASPRTASRLTKCRFTAKEDGLYRLERQVGKDCCLTNWLRLRAGDCVEVSDALHSRWHLIKPRLMLTPPPLPPGAKGQP